MPCVGESVSVDRGDGAALVDDDAALAGHPGQLAYQLGRIEHPAGAWPADRAQDARRVQQGLCLLGVEQLDLLPVPR